VKTQKTLTLWLPRRPDCFSFLACFGLASFFCQWVLPHHGNNNCVANNNLGIGSGNATFCPEEVRRHGTD
jgi:hypothetical protein